MSRFRAFPTATLAFLALLCAPVLADPAGRFAAGRELMHDGNFDAALAVFDELHDEFPADVDYAFARGQALAALGRDRDALAQLQEAIRLAPHYEAVWRARYALLARQPDPAELDAFRERAALRFPTATWWQPPRTAPQQRWTLLLGGGREYLSNDLPDWDSRFAELSFRPDDSRRFAVRLGRDARDDVGDTSTGVSAEWQLDDWFAGAGAGYAHSPAFQPRTRFELHAGKVLRDGWVASLRFRHRAYDAATVSGFAGTFEKYVGDYRLAYVLGWSQLHGASGFMSHGLSGNWYYAEESAVGLSLSAGREAEAIGGGRVLETDVAGIALSGRHRLNRRLGLQWWLGVHEQGDLYRRRFLGMAVSIKL